LRLLRRPRINHILAIDWIIFVPYSKAIDGNEASEILEAGRFKFKEDSSMAVVFFLRVNSEETLMLDSKVSEVINSTGGGASKLKQRNRGTKMVL